ncbi:hypothetical protein D3C84_891800 [compost metagenome]
MRWMLLLLIGLGLPAMAELEYSLKPRQIPDRPGVMARPCAGPSRRPPTSR